MGNAAGTQPLFRNLSTREIARLLKVNHVGRIAFSFHDSVDIRPVHYVYTKGWLFGRTSPGDKLITLRHNQWVAFEVDEIDGPFDWISVIVRGSFYRLMDTGSESDRKLYRRGLRHIRKLMPDALGPKDPVPFRTEVFGIAIDSATGKSCKTPTVRQGS